MAENTLDPNDYYSQRNNALKPGTACNVTALVMAACQAGRLGEMVACQDYHNSKRMMDNKDPYKQPEDSIMSHLNMEKWRQHAMTQMRPQYYNRPEEVWSTLVAGFNEWFSGPIADGPHGGAVQSIARIDWNCSRADLMVYIDKGYGVVASGSFPTTKGHFVNIGGYTAHGIVINDSWGNYLTEYKDIHGYGIEMPFSDYDRIIKGRNDSKGNGYKYVIVVEPYDE